MKIIYNNIESPISEFIGINSTHYAKVIDNRWWIRVNDEWVKSNLYRCRAYYDEANGITINLTSDGFYVKFSVANYSTLEKKNGYYDITPVVKLFKINGKSYDVMDYVTSVSIVNSSYEYKITVPWSVMGIESTDAVTYDIILLKSDLESTTEFTGTLRKQAYCSYLIVTKSNTYITVEIDINDYTALNHLAGNSTVYDITPLIKTFTVNGVDVHTLFYNGGTWYGDAYTQDAQIDYNSSLLNLSNGDVVAYDFELYSNAEHTATQHQTGTWTVTLPTTENYVNKLKVTNTLNEYTLTWYSNSNTNVTDGLITISGTNINADTTNISNFNYTVGDSDNSNFTYKYTATFTVLQEFTLTYIYNSVNATSGESVDWYVTDWSTPDEINSITFNLSKSSDSGTWYTDWGFTFNTYNSKTYFEQFRNIRHNRFISNNVVNDTTADVKFLAFYRYGQKLYADDNAGLDFSHETTIRCYLYTFDSDGNFVKTYSAKMADIKDYKMSTNEYGGINCIVDGETYYIPRDMETAATYVENLHKYITFEDVEIPEGGKFEIAWSNAEDYTDYSWTYVYNDILLDDEIFVGKANNVYTFSTNGRGILYAATDATSITNVASVLDTDKAAQFAIINGGTNNYLYSVGENKFVDNTGELTDTISSSCIIYVSEVSSTSEYKWYFKWDDSHVLNFRSVSMGISIDNYTYADAGNSFKRTAVAYADISEATQKAVDFDSTL